MLVCAAFLVFAPNACSVRDNGGVIAPVPLGFPDDFPALVDCGGRGAGGVLTGFGGARTDRSNHRPVVLLHGNGTPAQEIWKHYSAWLLEAGYAPGDIWAVNYLGRDGGAENPGAFRNNVNDVRLFIDAVLGYLGVDRVDIVALSLGCHLARGYLLGGTEEGAFDPALRRADRIATLVLVSGANYGLGIGIDDPDWSSASDLFSPDAQNSFIRVDGLDDHTPFSETLRYVTIFSVNDYPQTLYNRLGGGHPSGVANTSMLIGAENIEIGADVGLGYPDTAASDSNFENHPRLVSDPYVFSTHVLAVLRTHRND